MIYTCETTQSKITTPGVFRHTPYEHETTTDIENLMTPVEPDTLTTVGQHASDGMVVVPSLR
jgi:hypothetical protein